MTSIRAEIDGLREDMRTLIALVGELINKETQYQKRLKRRNTLLCELAKAVGPISAGTFEQVEAIIDERQMPPIGCEHIIKWFQNNPELVIGTRQIGRVVKLELTTLPSGCVS